MLRSVLCVDDEPKVLDGLRRLLRKRFDLQTAIGGEEGLKILASQGPFAVVVSDMRMPSMNGIEFLTQVQERSPDTVRMMLTGNADQETAVAAVNTGNVFRFLNKPCAPDDVVDALEVGLRQYQLVTTERELLDGTVKGSIKLLTDVLSMTDPESFGRAAALRDMARSLAEAVGLEDIWSVEIAAMLSQLGRVSIPSEILTKERAGSPLSSDEKAVLATVPEVGSKLLRNIPRLGNVADMVLHQERCFENVSGSTGVPSGKAIPAGARVLKVLHDFQRLQGSELSTGAAIHELKGRIGTYDPDVLAALVSMVDMLGDDAAPALCTKEVAVLGLRPGQRLMSDIRTRDGRVLIAKDRVISETILEKLYNYGRLNKILEPIQVTEQEGISVHE